MYSSVKITQGKQRSLLQDLVNGRQNFIPISYGQFLVENNNMNYNQIIKKYKKENEKITSEYLTHAIQNNYATILNGNKEDAFFIPVNFQWFEPYIITNCILVFNVYDEIYLEKILLQIIYLEIPYIEIRILNNFSLNELDYIIVAFQNTSIISINILTIYDNSLKIKEIKNKLKFKVVVNALIIYNSPVKQTLEYFMHSKSTSILFTKQKLSSSMCGLITTQNFTTNLKLYSESLVHNTCLNRKISIDQNGEIKNCPSMVESFGNIKDTTLEEALNKQGFKKYWNITKDKINICKDCEFRNVCTDCRAYIQDPADIYSKPLKCGYDPYTNIWEEWSTNPLSKKAIEHYGMQELVKNDAN